MHSSLAEQPAISRPGTSLVVDVIRLCRPHQWIKNVFVLAPLVFSGEFFRPAAWLATLIALASFCLLSSTVYAFNDLLDAPADRLHPRKKSRPIAAGRVSPVMAVAGIVLLLATALALGVLFLPWGVLAVGGGYLLNSLLYCLLLKHRVIIDVLAIAIGFILRLLAGCFAIGVQPTSWLLVCGFSLALVLGFGKRRLEIDHQEIGQGFRPVLLNYTRDKLNLLLGVTSAVCLLSYMLFTISASTVALHGTENLIYTVPIVTYGLFRYLFKVQEAKHDGPVEVLTTDPIFWLTGVMWIAVVVAVLYWPW